MTRGLLSKNKCVESAINLKSMKRGGISLTSDSYNIVLQEKHQVLSTTSRRVNQKLKNQKWCILCFMLLSTCFVLCVKKYYSITFKGQVEQVLMFPVYSVPCQHCNFRRNYLPNISTTHSETRLRQVKAITRSEKYYPMTLRGGFLHTDLESGYCLRMTIGKAKQVYSFYIDTGSSVTWLFCNWPKDINQQQLTGPSGLYDPFNGAKLIRKDSSLCLQYKRYIDTSSKDVCQLRCGYADSFRLLTIMCEEEVELYNQYGQKLSSIMNLGCGHSMQNEGKYLTSPQTFNYDGTVGMDKGPRSIIKKFKDNGVIKSSVLVLCLLKEQNNVGKSVGFVIFGQPSFLQLMENHLKWTEMVPFGECKSHAYVIRADVIELGSMNTKHEFPNIKVMNFDIDTGTSAIFLRKNVYDKILERIITVGRYLNYKEEKIEDYTTCLRFPPYGANPQLDFDTLRVGVIGLNGFHYILIYPDQYLRWKGMHDHTGNYLCVAMEDEAEDPRNPNYFGILGAQAIQDTLIVFDNESNLMGWKSSTCNEVESELTVIENNMYGRSHKRPRRNP